MKSRRTAREFAIQCFYQCDTLADWSEEAIELFFSNFIEPIEDKKSEAIENFLRELIFGTRKHLEIIDRQISLASERWSISRMARVDRNILRLACYEMGFVQAIPINVSINEAIELAKAFAAEDSPMFINGILDNIAGLLADNPELFTEQEELQKVG